MFVLIVAVAVTAQKHLMVLRTVMTEQYIIFLFLYINIDFSQVFSSNFLFETFCSILRYGCCPPKGYERRTG